VTTDPMTTFHILRVGSAHRTLCGVEGTALQDAFLNEARDIVAGKKTWDGYLRCEVCFARLLALDFKRSEKVED
jgi:hypothetical protein